MNKPILKKADEAIKHFESAGREVVGVAIIKDGFKLEFASTSASAAPVDLVNMGEK